MLMLQQGIYSPATPGSGTQGLGLKAELAIPPFLYQPLLWRQLDLYESVCIGNLDRHAETNYTQALFRKA